MCDFRIEISKTASPDTPVWECPFDPYKPDFSRCIFHLSEEKQNIRVSKYRDKFIEAIKSDDREKNKIIGASIPELNLTNTTIISDNKTPIDFSKSKIEKLNLDNSSIHQPILGNDIEVSEFSGNGMEATSKFKIENSSIKNININEGEFQKRLQFINSNINNLCMKRSTYNRGISFIGCYFEEGKFIDIDSQSESNFSDSIFSSKLEFQYGEFDRTIFSGCTFEEGCQFKRMEFTGDVVFSSNNLIESSSFKGDLEVTKSRFTGETNLEDIHFNSSVEIVDSDFLADFSFSSSDFKYACTINDCKFEGKMFSSDCDFESLECENTVFQDEAMFSSSIFRSKSDFSNSIFNTDVMFNKVEFMGTVNFQQAKFETGHFHDTVFKTASFRSVEMSEVHFQPIVLNFEEIFDFAYAEINKGFIEKSKGHLPYFDFSHATLGEIRLMYEREENIFNFIRFHDTKFNGFNFSRYRNELEENDYIIHSLSNGKQNYRHQRRKADKISTGVTLNRIKKKEMQNSGYYTKVIENFRATRRTYAKAKKSAKEGGSNDIARKFFIKEMKIMREMKKFEFFYSNEVSGRLKSGGEVILNRLFYHLCGYGEKTSWTILSSLSIILLFSLLYWLLGLKTPYPKNRSFIIPAIDLSLSAEFIKYIIFSFQSFTTLVVAGGAQVTDWKIRLVSSIEGFLGAFLIALFVYSLTNTIEI